MRKKKGKQGSIYRWDDWNTETELNWGKKLNKINHAKIKHKVWDTSTQFLLVKKKIHCLWI